jgi:hypothetical protein
VPVSLTIQLITCVMTSYRPVNKIAMLSRYNTWINKIYEDLSAIYDIIEVHIANDQWPMR